jgi:4-carboxymuconolactone decarboxylase
MPFEHSDNPRVTPIYEPEPEVAELLDKTRGEVSDVPLAIFRTMAHHPRLLKRFNLLGGFFLGRGELPARERELAILRTAWRSQAVYEWAQHVVIGRRAGITDEEITRIAQTEIAAEWSDDDRTLMKATDELLDGVDISDAVWAALGERWNETERIELVMLIGFYRMVAGFLNATGVQPEEHLPGWPTKE